MFELARVRDIGSFYEKVLVTAQKECQSSSSCLKLELTAVLVIGIILHIPEGNNFGKNWKIKR